MVVVWVVMGWVEVEVRVGTGWAAVVGVVLVGGVVRAVEGWEGTEGLVVEGLRELRVGAEVMGMGEVAEREEKEMAGWVAVGRGTVVGEEGVGGREMGEAGTGLGWEAMGWRVVGIAVADLSQNHTPQGAYRELRSAWCRVHYAQRRACSSFEFFEGLHSRISV